MSLLNDASLVLTPNAVKASKLYSIIPSNGNGDMDVVRATTATRTNSLGIIESVAANIPRLNYDSVGDCPNILVEPQRTNLDPNSQTFVGWTLNNSGGVTTSAVTATNPYNFATVQKVIPSAVSGQHRPFLSVNYTANGRIWVIAKADGYNFLSLGDGGGLSGGTIIFNLSDGTISGTASGYTASISSLGNGWYKCSMNIAFTGLTGRWIVIRNNNTTADYVGDGTSGILIAHKQLEVGEYDTTSILTNGAIATRNADIISKTGISSLMNPSQGTFYVEAAALNNVDTIARWFALGNAEVGTNLVSIQFPPIGSQIRFDVFGGGNNNRLTLSGMTITNFNKIALSWSSLGSFAYVNGVKYTIPIVSGAVNAVPTALSRIDFDAYYTGQESRSKIKSAVIFKTQLTDAECIALTTL